ARKRNGKERRQERSTIVDQTQQRDLSRKLQRLVDALEPKGETQTEPSPTKGTSVQNTAAEMPSGLFELAAAEGPYERVIICRSLGTATVYIKGSDLYIVPNGRLHR